MESKVTGLMTAPATSLLRAFTGGRRQELGSISVETVKFVDDEG
jgi:hypothetical protein